MIDLDEPLDHLEHQRMLPAIVVGYAERLEDPLDRPWLATLHQQYAGNGCRQQPLTGVLLPLGLRRDAEALVADLAVLGCGAPDDAPIRARPDLAPLHLCWQAYRPDQLVVLERVLAKGPPLPEVVAASEALVELDAREPLRFFSGWQVLSRELPRSVHLSDPLADHTAVGPVGLHEDQRLDARLLDALRALRTVPLRVFLVWWNSD